MRTAATAGTDPSVPTAGNAEALQETRAAKAAFGQGWRDPSRWRRAGCESGALRRGAVPGCGTALPVAGRAGRPRAGRPPSRRGRGLKEVGRAPRGCRGSLAARQGEVMNQARGPTREPRAAGTPGARGQSSSTAPRPPWGRAGDEAAAWVQGPSRSQGGGRTGDELQPIQSVACPKPGSRGRPGGEAEAGLKTTTTPGADWRLNGAPGRRAEAVVGALGGTGQASHGLLVRFRPRHHNGLHTAILFRDVYSSCVRT